MRWRVWMMVASSVCVVVATSATLAKKRADRDGVGRVVGALVDHLQHVVATDDGGGHLHAAGAPAIGHRHLAAAERHLIAGHGDAFRMARRIIRLVCSSR
jgi:hypothetical protein